MYIGGQFDRPWTILPSKVNNAVVKCMVHSCISSNYTDQTGKRTYEIRTEYLPNSNQSYNHRIKTDSNIIYMADSKRFLQWCTKLWITESLKFVHRIQDDERSPKNSVILLGNSTKMNVLNFTSEGQTLKFTVN